MAEEQSNGLITGVPEELDGEQVHAEVEAREKAHNDQTAEINKGSTNRTPFPVATTRERVEGNLLAQRDLADGTLGVPKITETEK